MTGTGKVRSDLATRTIVGVLLIAVAGAALWFGGLPFWLLAAVAGVLMMGEWAALAKAEPRRIRIAQYAVFVPLAVASPWAAGVDFFALGLLVGVAFFIAAIDRSTRLGLGALYVGLPVLALLLLRARPDGLVVTFSTMALVWATDIGAYFAGRAIGGPKLAPRVSPNKTWAGLAGGVAAAGLFAWAMHQFASLPVRLALAAPLLAVLAQMGDLFESHLKRRAGVKDSGTLLPGHGGVLDRLDGLVPVAPAAALIMLLPELIR